MCSYLWRLDNSNRDHGHGKGCWIYFLMFPKLTFENYMGSKEKKSQKQAKTKFWIPIKWKTSRNGLEEGMQHTLWAINRFLDEWDFFAMSIYHKMERHGSLCFTHYTLYVTKNYKTMFSSKHGSHTHGYMLEPIMLSTI